MNCSVLCTAMSCLSSENCSLKANLPFVLLLTAVIKTISGYVGMVEFYKHELPPILCIGLGFFFPEMPLQVEQ